MKNLMLQRYILLTSLAVIILATLALYYPVLQFEYIWDDLIIRQDYNYYSIDNPMLEAFGRSFLTSDYYRPIPVYSMILEAQLGGRSDGSYLGHWINLSLFIGCAILMVLVSARLLKHIQTTAIQWLPLLAGLLFVMHPATAVGAALVSVRFDLAMTFFGLLLLLCDMTIKSPLIRNMTTGVCFLLASLCKEMALAIACVLPFWHLFVAGKRWQGVRDYGLWIKDKGHISVYIAVFVGGCIYLALRFNALGELLSNDPSTDSSVVGNTWQHLLYIGKTFACYLTLIFWPFSAIKPAYYAAVPISNSDMMALAGVTTLIGCILLGMLQQHLQRLGWAALILVIALLPVLNIHLLPIHDNIVDLRFAYFPAVMAILLVTSTVATIAQSSRPYWNRILVPFTLLWILIGGLNIQLTLPLWKNDYTFWTWFVKVSPQSQIAYANYSNVLMRYKQYEAAIHYADLTIHETRMVSAGPWLNKGISQIYLHDFERGIQSLQTALEKTTSVELQAKAKSHIAKARISQGKYPEAELLLAESIALNPEHLHGYGQLARLGWLTKDKAMLDNAIANIERITGNNPATTRSVLQEAEVPDNATP